MSALIYSAIMSLDGYVADERGEFDWAAPDQAVHAFVNDLERPIGTYLYGRRMYEVMLAWETMADEEAVMQDYTSIWQAADKIVYSTSLDAVRTSRTRLERDFDPSAVQQLKQDSDRDLSVGGPGLAGAALRAGVVDECHFFLAPIAVGGGTAALPAGLHLGLDLLEHRRFGNGMVYLRYRVT